MIEEKTLAITLKSIPFKDRSKIISLLTLDLGIISVIANVSSKKNSLIAFTTPFTISEVVIRRKRSELYTLKDVKVTNSNLHLRKSLLYLKVASKMIDAIFKSQFPKKNSKNIFLLLGKYLENVSINPDAIYLSFLLKILLNDSMISPKEKCNNCKNIASTIDKGESLCIKCASHSSYIFDSDEYKTYLVLSQIRSFKYLKDLEITDKFRERIFLLFKELV
ncbi:MAG: DNA repair protein RecO [Candidatus Anoxychlamydiales bacterium]|nr:DNA repair protein RecO [Candidatus Anoxychlamydiales bacterium]